MSQSIGELEAVIQLGTENLKRQQKQAETSFARVGDTIIALERQNDRLGQSFKNTAVKQANSIQTTITSLQNEQRQMKLTADQQQVFTALKGSGLSANKAFAASLGQESKYHQSLVSALKTEIDATNKLKQSKQAERDQAAKKQQVQQAKIQEQTGVTKNVAALKQQYAVMKLSSAQQNTYNNLVRAGIPTSVAMASATGKMTREYRKEISEINKVNKKIQELNNARRVSASTTNRASTHLNGFAGALGYLLNPYTAAIAATAGLIMITKKLASSVVDANSKIENAGVRWEVLMGSMADAKTRMKEIQDFAARTPFQFEEISKGSQLLQVFGGDALATGKSLERLGDMAAFSQQPINELGLHFGRAYDAIQSGRPWGESALRLQELGLISGKARSKLERLRDTGASSTKQWEAFMQATSHTNGMMKKMSQTWTGLASTLRDNIFIIFQESSLGMFTEMKKGLEGLLNYVIANKKVISSWLTDWFNGVAKIVSVTSKMAKGLLDVALAVVKLTESEDALTKLNKQGMEYARTIVDMDEQIREAIKSQEAYNKTGDTSFAKQIGMSIQALKKQREEQVKAMNQVKLNVKILKDLANAESLLEKARADKRAKIAAEIKESERLAEIQIKLREAYEKVSKKISETIEQYKNKTRSLKLAGDAQILFNELLSGGVKGSIAFAIANGENTKSHTKNVSALKAEIKGYNDLKDSQEEAKKLAESKAKIGEGFQDTIKDLEKQKLQLSLNANQLKYFNAIIGAGLPMQDAYKSVTGQITQEYSSQINRIIQLTDEVTKLQEAQNKLSFSNKMKTFFEDLRKQAEDTALLVQNVIMSVSDNIADSISNAIVEGKFAWDDMFKSMLADVTSLIVKQLEYKAISGIGGAIYGDNADTNKSPLEAGLKSMFPMFGNDGVGTQTTQNNQMIGLLASIDAKMGVVAGKDMAVNISGGIGQTTSNLSSPTTIQQLSSLFGSIQPV